MDRRSALLGLAGAVAGISVCPAQTPASASRRRARAQHRRARRGDTQAVLRRDARVGMDRRSNDRVRPRIRRRRSAAARSVLAAELVARKPDLLFAPPSPAAVAAQQGDAHDSDRVRDRQRIRWPRDWSRASPILAVTRPASSASPTRLHRSSWRSSTRSCRARRKLGVLNEAERSAGAPRRRGAHAAPRAKLGMTVVMGGVAACLPNCAPR